MYNPLLSGKYFKQWLLEININKQQNKQHSDSALYLFEAPNKRSCNRVDNDLSNLTETMIQNKFFYFML